jgi:hypothetical protein
MKPIKHIAMQKLVITLTLLLIHITLTACPVCEKQQPKLLKGITHGAGPESKWDYVIIWATVAIVLVSLYLSLKWICQPGEKQQTHIKHTILNFE